MENDWIKKSIEISASDDKVWNTLTNSEFIKIWAAAFEEGCHIETDWTEGSTVVWKSRDGVNLIKGKVEVNYAPKLLKLRYFEDENAADDSELGTYQENYLLSEHEGKTALTIESGPLPDTYIKILAPQWDEALKIIKRSAEDQ